MPEDLPTPKKSIKELENKKHGEISTNIYDEQ